MWTEKNEKEFQSLIKRYKEDPSQKFEIEEIQLVRHLVECYVSAAPEPGAEVPFFKKLTSLYNIFLDAYCEKYPDMFQDKKTFDDILEQSSMQNEYIFFKVINAIINQMGEKLSKEEHDKTNAAYENFSKLIGFSNSSSQIVSGSNSQFNSLIGPEMTYLNPLGLYPFLYGDPEADPNDILSLPYNKRVEKIYEKIQSLKGEKLELTKERDALIQAFYRSQRSRTIKNIFGDGLRGYLKPETPLQIPHLVYDMQKFYPGHSARDILPHPLFEKMVSLHYSEDRIFRAGYSKPGAMLLGNIIAESSKDFSGYKVVRKTRGKDPGFILVSQDGKKRYYARATDNVVPEYLCSKLLSSLGIKMPEARLLVDEYGNKFYVSMDLSREYTKGEHSKTKEFRSLQDELERSPQVAFGFDKEKDHPSKEDQDEVVQKFLKEIASSKESRKSFAKTLLVGSAFGLSDLGGHGGNMGLIRTQKGGKNYCKFGLVDFQFHPIDITKDTKEISDAPLDYIRKNVLGDRVAPIFNKIFEQLTPDDFLTAAEELANPKERTYASGGLLLTSSPLTRVTNEKIIEATFKEVAEDLRKTLPEKEYKIEMERLKLQKDLITKNLTALTESIKKMKPPAGTERRSPPGA